MERLHRKRYGFVFALIVFMFGYAFFSCLFGSKSNNDAAFASGNSAYAVVRTDTFEVLLSDNGKARLPMASTTKIMTALIVIENCKPDEIVVIDKRSVGVEGSSVYLREGEKLTVKDLLYCLMLRSGNDAATALALHVAGSTENFAEMMNIRAESLNLTDTHFVNPHGLHDDSHFTSAHDLAIIAATAMNNPSFAEIVKTKVKTVGEGESKRTIANKNKMLSLYPDANGIKTGYTKKSGRCLVSSATKNGVTLVCAVLNYGDTYGLSSSLLDKGFAMICG